MSRDYVGMNNMKPTVALNWFDLEEVYDRYQWKKECPFCKPGLLLLSREDDGTLKEYDHCCYCGQRVVYNDITAMREHDWGCGYNGGYS